MKKFLSNLSLHSINFLGIIVLFLFALLFTFLVIFEEYRDFEQESIHIRNAYLATQKAKAKEETQRVLEYINYSDTSMNGKLDPDQIKAHVINSIEHLFDRKSGSSYIFIYTLEGVNISDPNKPGNRGKNMIDLQDTSGKYIIKALINEAESGGGYVAYLWENPVNAQLSAKVSYAAAYKPWNWMVGTGVYLDEIDAMINAKKEKMKERLIRYIMEVLTLSSILFWIAWGGIKLINGVIQKEMSTFRDFFRQSVLYNIVIDKRQIKIKEFQVLVAYVNEMVSAIHEKNRELRELNASLEEKVLQKTAKLQDQMQYNEKLVAAQDSFIKHSIHEVNTPLAVIMTHIDIYKMKHGENRYLTKIEAAAKMISTIYEDLSYMVKRDRLHYEKEWIDIKAYLLSRIKFFEEIAYSNEHRIVTELCECGNIWFNDLELQRIIDNNLSNAIKYAKRGTDIRIELGEEEGDIMIRFVTHSRKIEDTKKIFEAFHREDKVKSGFGLGLEIVGEICEKEGITIDVVSSEAMTVFSYRFKKGKKDENTPA
ncbi:MAG: cache domain-containing protein [Sulfurovum sp.]|nr:cache domain-containing protein [Sulfurovum sp.]